MKKNEKIIIIIALYITYSVWLCTCACIILIIADEHRHSRVSKLGKQSSLQHDSPTILIPAKHHHLTTESGGTTHSLVLFLLALGTSWLLLRNYTKSKILMFKLVMNLYKQEKNIYCLNKSQNWIKALKRLKFQYKWQLSRQYYILKCTSERSFVKWTLGKHSIKEGIKGFGIVSP